jgi:predicted RNase H-like HicB family nuclease
MTAETYSIIIFWSEEDEAFLAKVTELPGCMAHGETREEAMQEIKIAIGNWLETANALGREIPKPMHFTDFEKMADQGGEESLKEIEARFPDWMKSAMPAIAPALVEALAKEIAKSGQDVSISYDWVRQGLVWATRSRQQEQTSKR